MRSDDAADSLDRDDFDGEESEIFGPEASNLDSMEANPEVEADPDVEVVDEEYLEADLGELDAPILDDQSADLDDELLDGTEEEIDDEMEIMLLQELGIDLDARDDFVGGELELGVALHDDDSQDDEVAA